MESRVCDQLRRSPVYLGYEGGIDKAIDVALLASRFPVCNNPETVCMSIWKMKEGEKK